MMKWLLVIVIAIGYTAYHYAGTSGAPVTPAQQETVPQSLTVSGAEAIRQAFESKTSHVWVEAYGVAVKTLADDTEAPRHQRFIVKLDNGMTLLVLHNIDLAEKIPNLKVGDTVSFSGEYIWNSKGGLVHWTHRDPQKRRAAGWLKHNGNTYQ
jgi:uncharacterized protein DUF3465